jgi:hypothetical protein
MIDTPALRVGAEKLKQEAIAAADFRAWQWRGAQHVGQLQQVKQYVVRAIMTLWGAGQPALRRKR